MWRCLHILNPEYILKYGFFKICPYFLTIFDFWNLKIRAYLLYIQIHQTLFHWINLFLNQQVLRRAFTLNRSETVSNQWQAALFTPDEILSPFRPHFSPANDKFEIISIIILKNPTVSRVGRVREIRFRDWIINFLWFLLKRPNNVVLSYNFNSHAVAWTRVFFYFFL